MIWPQIRMAAYDVAVIGGGIVGCAILQRLTSAGYTCVLLEKSPNLVSGASCGNSGIRHSGYDTDINTLEGKCIAMATQPGNKFYATTGVPYNKCGAIMVAWTKEQMDRIPIYMAKARAAGQNDVRIVSKKEVARLEPGMTGNFLGGLLIPGEATMDPWLTAVSLAHAARRQGAQVSCNCEVQSGHQSADGTWTLKTSSATYKCKTVINAAGLYGDIVENIARPSHFTIKPRKGDFVVFGKGNQQIVKHIILPVPTERTKGVLIFPSVHGNIIVGPTADDVVEREVSQVSVDQGTVDKLIKWSQEVFPTLRDVPVLGTYVGLRPATEHKDYQIMEHPQQHWITVGGIRSTGATSAIGVAEYVHNLLCEKLHQKPSFPPPAGNSFGFEWHMTSKDSMTADGAEYTVTHPITQFGMFKGLKQISSKL